MEVYQCGKCGERPKPDDCSTQIIDLDCDHEFCTKCLLFSLDGADPNALKTLTCLQCDQITKLSKIIRRILLLAQDKMQEEASLKCNKHRDQTIQLICRQSGLLLCYKCLLEPPYDTLRVNFLKFD